MGHKHEWHKETRSIRRGTIGVSMVYEIKLCKCGAKKVDGTCETRRE